MAQNEGILRWSPNPSRNEFLTINLSRRLLQVYQATGHAKPDRFDHQVSSSYSNFPLPNTYDWSPIEAGLLAVGTSHGPVHLLRIDDSSNANLTLPVRAQRPCQSVAFNTTGLLAVGLDRVRSDMCLQIWDIEQRLSGWDPSKLGWDLPIVAIEPRKLDASLPVTSMKFFEDQPQSLVIGLKNSCLRILDLREPSPSVQSFQTKCNNNICIDYADPNYFASSSLDSPELTVWDRRGSTRSDASPLYQYSIENEDMVFGTALKLGRIIDSKKLGTYARSLRFCRDHRNMLGILSNAGRLQVLRLNQEYIEPGSDNDKRESPAFLGVKQSYDLGNTYYDEEYRERPENRIVSFDWLPLGTSDLQPRVIALRGNGAIDVLRMPATETGQLADLMPWVPPHRLGEPYMTLPRFLDSGEQAKVLGPLYISNMKAHMPVFGREKCSPSKVRRLLASALEKVMVMKVDPVMDCLALKRQSVNHQTGTKRLNRETLSNPFRQLGVGNGSSRQRPKCGVQSKFSLALSGRELHDMSHYAAQIQPGSSKAEWEQRGHVMLKRAVDGYLFNAKANKTCVVNDTWLQGVWEWISDAEIAASDNGMISTGVDLSYMGVFTIWNNLLGKHVKSRFINEVPVNLDASEWELLASSINERAGHREYDGIDTFWPEHRRLCLAVCGLAKSATELEEELKQLIEQAKLTMAAVLALFEGIPNRAVEILKGGGTSLLFVAMALDIKLKTTDRLELDPSSWSKALEYHPQLEEDPWLRAIYGYITTGNWEAIAEEAALPLRYRIGVALRNFRDIQLSDWLYEQMEEVTRTGDIEGIILAGITDNMVDILAKYIEKFNDYQTPVLIMSYSYPRYVVDARCHMWRRAYRDFLQRHKKFILRVRYEQQSTAKSRLRNGNSIIRPWPRQVTIRCLNCDAQATNDLSNTSTAGASKSASDSFDGRSNPLAVVGINAGLAVRTVAHILVDVRSVWRLWVFPGPIARTYRML